MALIYTKLADAQPIRTSGVSVSGATYAALKVTNDDTNSESYKYGQYPEKRIDYYYGKDDTNLKAVVGKVEITATDNYKAAKKAQYIAGTKTFAVGGTDTVEIDGAEYTWKATGTTAGAGAWEDEDGNPVDFAITVDENILDATIVVNGTSYTKNYLWLKNIVDNVAVGGAIPTTQTEGVSTLITFVSGLTGYTLVDKSNAASVEEESDEGYIIVKSTDANGDHEGREALISYTIFKSDEGQYTALLRMTNATNDYELAQALAALETGDKLDLTTLAIS